MPEEKPSGVERVLNRIDGVRRFFGGLLLVALAVAAMRTGGTAGWALGVGLLAFLGCGLVLDLRRRA
jgi:hypothetical protein